MAQARYIEESAVLAQAVEAALRERVPMSPRAIQQAPFRVLVGANMPAVLVEMGFITNPEQERQLGSDGFQNVRRPGARRQHRQVPRQSHLTEGFRCGQRRTIGWSRSPALMSRRMAGLLAIAVLAIAGTWLLFVASATLEETTIRETAPAPAAAAAERKITATLYYVSEDGMSLVGVAARSAVRRNSLDQAPADS